MAQQIEIVRIMKNSKDNRPTPWPTKGGSVTPTAAGEQISGAGIRRIHLRVIRLTPVSRPLFAGRGNAAVMNCKHWQLVAGSLGLIADDRLVLRSPGLLHRGRVAQKKRIPFSKYGGATRDQATS